MKKVFYWLPRILSILFIALISSFALDVFSESQWVLALFMHLIPSYFIVIITVIAWKHEVLGGFLFLTAGFVLLIFTHFEALIIGIPAFIVGMLFLITKYTKKI
jgi:hypothetical protein